VKLNQQMKTQLEKKNSRKIYQKRLKIIMLKPTNVGLCEQFISWLSDPKVLNSLHNERVPEYHG